MDGGVHQDLAAVIAVPLLGQGTLYPALMVSLRIKGVGEEHAAAAQIGVDPRRGHPLGDDAGAHIHVGDTGHARGDHLRQTQVGAAGHRPVIPPGLGGEDKLLQPVLKVVPVAVAPHGRHGHMGMGVDEARHQNVVPAVDLPVKGTSGTLGPYRGDFPVLHRHKGAREDGIGPVQQDCADVGNQGLHTTPPLHPLQALQHQAGELVLTGLGRVQHFLLAEGLVQDAGSHVGQERKAQHLHPAVPGHDDFGRGGHAYRVSPCDTGKADLCRGLILGTRQRSALPYRGADAVGM